jgi:hypothetical protein
VAWPEFGWSTDSAPELALPFARSKQLVDFDGARVASFAQRARASDGVEVFMSTLERARSAWHELEAEAPERMRTALREHWSRVPVLRALGGLATV